MSKISVIIPSYNTSQWIEKAIDSCIEQGMEYLKEIIVVEDFSSDNSWDVLIGLQKKYPAVVKPFMNKISGSNNARNYGFELSSGEYIQWLDSDDQLLPNKFKTQLAKFNEAPDADVVYSDWQMDFYEGGRFLKTQKTESKQYDDYLHELMINNWLPLHSYLHKRSMVEKAIAHNAWNPQTYLSQDREYITLSAILGAKFVYAPGNFSVYNRWSNATISQVGHRKSIPLSLALEKKFSDKIAESSIITVDKKKKYNEIANAVYLSSLFYYPGVKFYRKVPLFKIAYNSVHYNLRPLLPFLALFSWFKYFFEKTLGLPEFVKKVVRKLRYGFRFYFGAGHASILWRDLRLAKEPFHENDRLHLDPAMQWLKIAHNNSGSKGVSMSYVFGGGWSLAYPETTGYIIDTFIDYYKLTGEKVYFDRAMEMAIWEMEVQVKDGSVRVGTPANKTVDVFDTGMVLLGYTTLYSETKNASIYKAAIKCGDWLCNVMDTDGAWRTFSFKNIPHTYHSMVSWALFKLYLLSGINKYKEAVDKNIHWILSHKKENGWIDFMAFTEAEDPYTHTIGYTMQGLMELYKLRDPAAPLKQTLLETVSVFCETLLKKFNLSDKEGINNMFLLPGTVNKNWTSSQQYICLTGNAQMAIVYFDLYLLTQNKNFYNAGVNLVGIVKQTQRLNGAKDLKGGIAGSYPIGGGYHPNEYPNWAAKFFADALMKKINIDKQLNAG